MLSVACHESLPEPPPAEPAPAAYSFRRLAVTFDNDDRRGRIPRRRRLAEQTVSIPAYSRIVFRAGAVSVR
jgi:hypothetical protein